MDKLDFTFDPRELVATDASGLRNKVFSDISRVAGYPSDLFNGDNSKKRIQSVKVMARIFEPIFLDDFPENDYEKMINRISDEDFTYYIGKDFIIIANPYSSEVYLYMYTQNQHSIVQGKIYTEKGYNFYSFRDKYPLWVHKSISLSLNKTTPVAIGKSEPEPIEDLLTVEDEELLKDIEKQYYAIVGEPMFDIKTRVFMDTGRFDTNYADQKLDSTNNPILCGFVPACIENKTDLDLIKELVLQFKKKGIAVSTGKWYINGNFVFHYTGSQGTKLIHIGEQETQIFPMERKATSNGIFHTVSLPISLKEDYEQFKKKEDI